MQPDGGDGGGWPGEDDSCVEIAETGHKAVETEQRCHLAYIQATFTTRKAFKPWGCNAVTKLRILRLSIIL